MKAALFISIILFSFYGCDIFSTRDAEEPTQPRSNLPQAFERETLIDNLILSHRDKTVFDYLNCLSDSQFSMKSFTFFASRFPFEVWILPKKHGARFEIITAKEITELVEIFSKVMKKLSKSLNAPPYNYFIHTAPAKIGHHSIYYHWHLEITPRLSKLGAYEIGSDVVIDVVSPESAAKFLRKA